MWSDKSSYFSSTILVNQNLLELMLSCSKQARIRKSARKELHKSARSKELHRSARSKCRSSCSS